MVYKILPYSYQQAKKHNVIIKPSTNKRKKIDVFDKDMNKLASIGGIRSNGIPYNDYPTYLESIGLESANKKRKAYLARHAKEPKMKDGKRTPSYWAKTILW